MRILSIWLGKILIWLMRRRGSGGSALPGLVIERLYPKIIPAQLAKLPDGAIMVTGTNGKTTTAKAIRTILADSGKEVIANRAGSNMSRGIASTLVEHCDWSGRLRGDVAVFEVDEAFTGDVAAKVRPQVMAVLNLARDQLDRYGELDRTAKLIADGLQYADHAVLNGDDPLVVALAKGLASSKVTFFGATKELRGRLPADEELHGSKTTRAARELDFTLTKSRDNDYGQAVNFKYQDSEYQTILGLPGTFNAYNVLAAIAASVQAGVGIDSALKTLPKVKPAFGRSEVVEFEGKTLQLLLVKNPAGLNQVIETFLRKDSDPILFAINDYFADGRDVSWLWDVDFERLRGRQRPVLASGTRGYDLALRLKYADLASDVELDTKQALARFVRSLKTGQTGYIVPTYTAMLALRKQLARQGELEEMWQ